MHAFTGAESYSTTELSSENGNVVANTKNGSIRSHADQLISSHCCALADTSEHFAICGLRLFRYFSAVAVAFICFLSRASEFFFLTQLFPCSYFAIQSAMDVLADVEVQLILQLLTNTERLIAARTSRRMLALCTEHFAWKCATVVEIRSSSEHLALLSCSLLRHAPISLLLDSEITLALFADLPPLTQLCVLERFQRDPEPWHAILQTPCVQHLQHFSGMDMHQNFDCSTLEQLAALPYLQSYHVLCDSGHPSDYFSPLARSASLTELSIVGSWFASAHPCMSGLTALRGLKKLSVERLCFPKGEFRAVLASPSLSSLVELSFTSFICKPHRYDCTPTSEDWQVSFMNLQCLERLTLFDANGFSTVLPHVPLLSALQLMRLTCSCTVNPDWDKSPARGDLQAVLEANSKLQIQLHVKGMLQDWKDFCRESDVPDIAAGQWEDVQSMAGLPRVSLVAASAWERLC
jgi:hypothetical protein